MNLREINFPLFKYKPDQDILSGLYHLILFLMSVFLSTEQIAGLRALHRKSREKLVCDKIKALLLLNSGYSYEQIAEFLLLDDSTIRRWHAVFEDKGINSLLSDNFTGSTSKLNEKQLQKLVRHPEHNVYLTAKEVCDCVLKKFRVNYTVKGMTSRLHSLDLYPSGLMHLA
jgi:transposase